MRVFAGAGAVSYLTCLVESFDGETGVRRKVDVPTSKVDVPTSKVDMDPRTTAQEIRSVRRRVDNMEGTVEVQMTSELYVVWADGTSGYIPRDALTDRAAQ